MPPRIIVSAAARDTVTISPSQSVLTTTLKTGVASNPSEIVTAGKRCVAIAMAQYGRAVPGIPP